jgi:hypothetical protein
MLEMIKLGGMGWKNVYNLAGRRIIAKFNGEGF